MAIVRQPSVGTQHDPLAMVPQSLGPDEEPLLTQSQPLAMAAQSPGIDEEPSAMAAQSPGIDEEPLAMVAQSPGTEEGDERRRLRKRKAAVDAIKRSPEYARLLELRLRMLQEGGQGWIDESCFDEPDPTDLSLSKRAWESQVMAWRRYMRGLEM